MTPYTAPWGRVRFIQAVVADSYDISRQHMRSKDRRVSVTHPRHIAMYLARKLTSYSLPRIGREFGGRDHSTVINAIARVEKRMAADPMVELDVLALREALA